MKHLGELLLPLDRMLVYRRVTPPAASVSPVPIYTPGWRERKRSKVPCLRKQRDRRGLNHGPPDPLEVLTTEPHTSPLFHNNLCKIITYPSITGSFGPSGLAPSQKQSSGVMITHGKSWGRSCWTKMMKKRTSCKECSPYQTVSSLK